MSQTEYIAGTCNIGGGELTRRRMVAILGLILTLSSAATLISTEASRQSRLGIFLPALVMSVGWVQSRKKFCLAYGFMGTFNFGKLGQFSRVADKAAKRADRLTAISIMLQALVYAAAGTAVMYLLPTSIW